MIVQALHQIQHRHRYLPEAELRALAERTGTPLYRLQEVASFFPHFKLKLPPAVEVHVCHDMACHQHGCALLKQDVEQSLATDIATIPEDIRGYGHIKAKSVVQANQKKEKLVAQFHAAIAAQASATPR